MLTDELYSQYVVDAADMPEDQRIPHLTSVKLDDGSSLSQEDIDEILEGIQELNNFDQDQDLNIANKEPEDAAERLSSDAEDELEQKAQKMADEDKTVVKQTEVDKDSDGDTDKVTTEKVEAEDDSQLTDEDRAILDSMDSDNSNPAEDKPHEDPENRTNSIARLLGDRRF